jgi:hypothetical protein
MCKMGSTAGCSLELVDLSTQKATEEGAETTGPGTHGTDGALCDPLGEGGRFMRCAAEAGRATMGWTRKIGSMQDRRRVDQSRSMPRHTHPHGSTGLLERRRLSGFEGIRGWRKGLGREIRSTAGVRALALEGCGSEGRQGCLVFPFFSFRQKQSRTDVPVLTKPWT